MFMWSHECKCLFGHMKLSRGLAQVLSLFED